jgi:hypothetical protein
MSITNPARHHLDGRAHQLLDKIAGASGDHDDLLATKHVASWLGVSIAWLEIGRSKGYPAMNRTAERATRMEVTGAKTPLLPSNRAAK